MTYTFTQFVQLFCNVVRDVTTKKKNKALRSCVNRQPDVQHLFFIKPLAYPELEIC